MIEADPCHYDTLSTVVGGESQQRKSRIWRQVHVEVGGFAEVAEQEANARLIAAAPDLAEVARAYEQWEADLIASPEAWGGAFPGGERDLPKFTEALWDRLLEIQAMRNAALAKVSQQQGSPQAQGQQNEGVES